MRVGGMLMCVCRTEGKRVRTRGEERVRKRMVARKKYGGVCVCVCVCECVCWRKSEGNRERE